MLGAPMARAQLARARSGVCGLRQSRHSVQRLEATPRARRQTLGRRLCFRRPSGLAPMAAPSLRGANPGRPRLDGAGGGGEGRGGDLMAGAARQVVAGDSLLVFPKTWRRRLAVRRAGVADRGRDDELRGAPAHLLAPAARPDVEHVAEVVALPAADAGPPGQPVFLPAGRSPAAHGDPDLRAPEAGRLASWPPSARRRWGRRRRPRQRAGG